MRERAKTMGTAIRAEDCLSRAVGAIEAAAIRFRWPGTARAREFGAVGAHGLSSTRPTRFRDAPRSLASSSQSTSTVVRISSLEWSAVRKNLSRA